jgi:FKBP12-rapamycin complex-associated protein
LHALGEWEDLSKVSQEAWNIFEEDSLKRTIAPYGAVASFSLKNWGNSHCMKSHNHFPLEHMEQFVEVIQEETVEGGFYRAILAIHHDQYDQAQVPFIV